jgi:peptidoglycan/xylan/chitin deacetylase (PgdA/CDA1 family)
VSTLIKLPALEDTKRLAKRAANLIGGRVVILLYHRVAELPTDPQLLSVSPANFSEHLQILQRYGNPISLQAVGKFIEQRFTKSHRVSVTFDDGYADNLHNAKPLLEKYGVPATVFVTSGYLGSPTGFWKDTLSSIFLQPTELPPSSKCESTVTDTDGSWVRTLVTARNALSDIGHGTFLPGGTRRCGKAFTALYAG